MVAAGKFKETRNHNTLHLLLSFGLALGLGLPFGLTGVTVGIIIAHIIRVGIQLWYVPKTIIKSSYKSSLWRIIRSLVTIFLIALPIRLWLPCFPGSFIAWLGFAALTGLYAVAVTIGIRSLFERPGLKRFFSRVEKKKKK